MGIKRRLDYICSSHSLFIGETGPTDMLNLGSDHKAVRSVFVVARKKLKHRIKKVPMKAWRPIIDADGNASKYQQALQEVLERSVETNIENVDQVLYEAATCPGVRVEVPNESKPWYSEDLQGLIQQRRVCSNSSDRSLLSKRIQKLIRAILRKH